MPNAYYGTKISGNMTKTPEGYLICHSVPIARTGWQDYTAEEIGADAQGIVKVHRHPDDVFHPATLASFEGKDVTDLHPSQWVDTTNHSSYSRGHIQNVRKGEGADDGYLLGDLHVKDAPLISKIESGQREVSCGYNCDYEPTGAGTYAQKNIRGNHVAVVPNGRAGNAVSIRDHQPIQAKENRKVAKNILQHILGLGLKKYAEDADPEEVAKAAEAVKEKKDDAKDACGSDAEVAPVAATPNAHASEMGQILEALKGIEGRIAKLEGSEAAEAPSPEESLDSFVSELEGEDPKKAKPAGDTEVVPVETLSPKDLPKNPIPGADSAAIVAAVRAMKPIIAAMADPKAKRAACDALIAAYRPAVTQSASYAALARAKAQDAAKSTDDGDYGRELREKYHRKNTVR